VTGIIAATGGNGQGVVGVVPYPGICLLIARAFGDFMSGSFRSDVDAGTEWCADMGARVINLSLGTSVYSQSTERLITSLEQEGVLLVSASGNDGDSKLNYPASYSAAMSVGSIDQNYTRSFFSQYNSQVDIVAPGAGINSTAPALGIRVNDGSASFQAALMIGSPIPLTELTGPVFDCGTALSACIAPASNMICAVQRDQMHPFGDKALNAQASGNCQAVVIYNNESPGLIGGTVSKYKNNLTIPVLEISLEDGLLLLSTTTGPATVSILLQVGGYLVLSGTSMATPHVTGAAARIWSVRPACTNAQVRLALELTARPLGSNPDEYGKGLVQIEAAYNFLLSLPPPCGTGTSPGTPPIPAPSPAPSRPPSIPNNGVGVDPAFMGSSEKFVCELVEGASTPQYGCTYVPSGTTESFYPFSTANSDLFAVCDTSTIIDPMVANCICGVFVGGKLCSSCDFVPLTSSGNGFQIEYDWYETLCTELKCFDSFELLTPHSHIFAM
jgi:serine protease